MWYNVNYLKSFKVETHKIDGEQSEMTGKHELQISLFSSQPIQKLRGLFFTDSYWRFEETERLMTSLREKKCAASFTAFRLTRY